MAYLELLLAYRIESGSAWTARTNVTQGQSENLDKLIRLSEEELADMFKGYVDQVDSPVSDREFVMAALQEPDITEIRKQLWRDAVNGKKPSGKRRRKCYV